MWPNNYASYPKTPNKIDSYMFLKLEANYRDQIEYLKQELNKRDQLIRELSGPTTVIQESKPEAPKNYQSVGKVNPARALAEMEIRERENYWKKVMEDKEKLAAKNNTVMVD